MLTVTKRGFGWAHAGMLLGLFAATALNGAAHPVLAADYCGTCLRDGLANFGSGALAEMKTAWGAYLKAKEAIAKLPPSNDPEVLRKRKDAFDLIENRWRNAEARAKAYTDKRFVADLAGEKAHLQRQLTLDRTNLQKRKALYDDFKKSTQPRDRDRARQELLEYESLRATSQVKLMIDTSLILLKTKTFADFVVGGATRVGALPAIAHYLPNLAGPLEDAAKASELVQKATKVGASGYKGLAAWEQQIERNYGDAVLSGTSAALGLAAALPKVNAFVASGAAIAGTPAAPGLAVGAVLLAGTGVALQMAKWKVANQQMYRAQRQIEGINKSEVSYINRIEASDRAINLTEQRMALNEQTASQQREIAAFYSQVQASGKN